MLHDFRIRINAWKRARASAKAFGFLLLLTLPQLANAGVDLLSEQEFRALANEISHKVNLFKDVWAKDPEAEFYGGTTRDYLYWLRGKFRDAHSRADVDKITAQLRARPIINIREFIIGDSDVDIITKQYGLARARSYGVRAIDHKNPEIFDPKSESYASEHMQGHIPAEKIRLANSGFVETTDMGNGLQEIYRGRLSLVLPDPKVFAQTKYAREGTNHPILLVLRYMRLQAMQYFNDYGRDFPDKTALLSGIDPATQNAIQNIVKGVGDGKALAKNFEQENFARWFNGSLQKGFRSYTNPTAMMELVKHFGIVALTGVYEKIAPINQFLFSKFRDQNQISAALRKFKVDRGAFFSPTKQFFPDGYIYHGTRSDPNFRSIIFQGVLPSEAGNAGAGLYGVGKDNLPFAETWGGSAERVVRIEVKPEAKIVDIRTGEGLRIWNLFKAQYGEDYEKFAEMFGADMLAYPYSTQAFVVKNSSILGKANGINRQLLPLPELLERAKSIKTTRELLETASLNSLNTEEEALLLSHSSITTETVRTDLMDSNRLKTLLTQLSDSAFFRLRDAYLDYPEIDNKLLGLTRSSDAHLAERAFSLALARNSQSETVPEALRAIVIARANGGLDAVVKLMTEVDRLYGSQNRFTDIVRAALKNKLRNARDFIQYAKSCGDADVISCFQPVMNLFYQDADFSETMLRAAADSNFPERNHYASRALERLFTHGNREKYESEAALLKLLDILEKGDFEPREDIFSKIFAHASNIDAEEFSKYGIFHHRLVRLLLDPRNAAFEGSILYQLAKANTLSAEDTSKLTAKYMESDNGRALALVEKNLRENKMTARNYARVVNKLLVIFPTTTGSNLGAGFDFYSMDAVGKALMQADFTEAHIQRESIQAFAEARHAFDSRASDFYRDIMAKLTALDANGAIEGAPRARHAKALSAITHEALVNQELAQLQATGAGSRRSDAMPELGKILIPDSVPADRKVVENLLRSQDPFLDSFLQYFFSREGMAKWINTADGAKAAANLKILLAEHPEYMTTAIAEIFPALARQELEKNLENLVRKGDSALDGYLKLLEGNTAYTERVRAVYRENPLTPLSRVVPKLIPDFRLSREQLEQALADNPHTRYSLEVFFQNNSANTKLLLAHAIRTKDSGLVSDAIRFLPEHPEITFSDSAFKLLLKNTFFYSEIKTIMQRLPKERQQELASILIQNNPMKLAEFEFLTPLNEENQKLLQAKIAKFKPEKIDPHSRFFFTKIGANPPLPPEKYTAAFIEAAAARSEDAEFSGLIRSHIPYREFLQKQVENLNLSEYAKIRLYLNAPNDFTGLITPEVIDFLHNHPRQVHDLSQLAWLFSKDAGLSAMVFNFYKAHPNLEPLPQLLEDIPEFHSGDLRAKLARINNMDEAMELFHSTRRTFDLSPDSLRRLLPIFLADPALPLEARYVIAYQCFYLDANIAEARPILEKLLADPRFLKHKQYSNYLLLSNQNLAPSQEKAALSLELLAEAEKAGIKLGSEVSQVYGNFGLFSGTYKPKSAEAYLHAMVDAVRSGKVLRGSPEDIVYAIIVKAAESYGKELTPATMADLALLNEFHTTGRMPAAEPARAGNGLQGACGEFAEIGKLVSAHGTPKK